MPVAAPVTWKKIEIINKPTEFDMGGAKDLAQRAALNALIGWKRADQMLINL